MYRRYVPCLSIAKWPYVRAAGRERAAGAGAGAGQRNRLRAATGAC